MAAERTNGQKQGLGLRWSKIQFLPRPFWENKHSCYFGRDSAATPRLTPDVESPSVMEPLLTSWVTSEFLGLPWTHFPFIK